jgi:DNA-binding cell septation regulator SpoVG
VTDVNRVLRRLASDADVLVGLLLSFNAVTVHEIDVHMGEEGLVIIIVSKKLPADIVIRELDVLGGELELRSLPDFLSVQYLL